MYVTLIRFPSRQTKTKQTHKQILYSKRNSFNLSQIDQGVVLKQQQKKLEEKYFSLISFNICQKY